MSTAADDGPTAPSRNSGIPDDTVFYALYPGSNKADADGLAALHLRVLDAIASLVADYIWQHEPFHLSPAGDGIGGAIPTHLQGKTRFGDNLEDEWFVVFLLFHISRAVPSLSIQVSDSDGQFLLIEAAYSLPRWLNPDTAANRVFIRGGSVHIIPRKRFPSNPPLIDALWALAGGEIDTRAPESVQVAIQRRIAEYPERARRNVHRAVARVPASVAWVVRHEPCLISAAVEGFYDRDIDSMKFAARMERFLEKGRSEELVRVPVRMSRAMYAQLVRQNFHAPKCYPMPSRSNGSLGEFLEAELGMKIACGFEMMYQMRQRLGSEGKGSAWEVFKERLESNGYFRGLLPGSNEYNELLEKSQEYYRQSALFTRTSEMLNAPVRRIDELLSLPYTAADFDGSEVSPSDDDSWLYDGESELNIALQGRQQEMDFYEENHKKNEKTREKRSNDNFAGSESSNVDFTDIAKSMQAFVHKISSFEGAEIPEKSDSKEVDLDVERFLKDIESAMGRVGQENAVNSGGSTSSSEMDFDDLEEDDSMGDDEEVGDPFMQSYSDALNEELKKTTLQKSFIRANETSKSANEGTCDASNNMDEEDLRPLDVDVNLVKSLLDSFSSQEGLPGPASNLLGVMGLKLPDDARKGK